MSNNYVNYLTMTGTTTDLDHFAIVADAVRLTCQGDERREWKKE